jgi:tetratricopeptide (TPR) repeat protein
MILAGALALTVGLLFARTSRFEFVNFDDDKYVTNDPPVARGLSPAGLVWAFTDTHTANWIPVTWISLMIDCQLYGEHAGGHHMTNVLLHSATAGLLLWVLWSMTGRLWPSALAAAVFALHPLRVESVVWVTERKDVLSGLFFMLALGAYVAYVRRPFSLGRYLAVVVFFALGLMAKPILVTFPCLLLVLDYWPLERFRSWNRGASGRAVGVSRLFFEKLPLVALSAASCVVAVRIQGTSMAATGRFPLSWRLESSLLSYVFYLGKFFWPVNLAVLYPRVALFSAWKVLAAAVLLAGISAAVFHWRRRLPYLLVGWLWYLGMMVPVIGLLQVGVGNGANRFTYLSQIGVAIALAWAWADLCRWWRATPQQGWNADGRLLPERLPEGVAHQTPAPFSATLRPWAFGAFTAFVLAAMMARTWQETGYWRDSLSLWRHTLACTGPNHVAETNYGAALANAGQYEEAIVHFSKALQFNRAAPLVHLNLGHAFEALNRIDEAMHQYPKAAGNCDQCGATAHDNLGVILSRRGQTVEAVAHFQAAIEAKPDFAPAHFNCGLALIDLDRMDEAIGQFRETLAIDPGYLDAHTALGNLLAARGRFAEAMDHYKTVLASSPDNARAVQMLAWLQATAPQPVQRNAKEAVELARWACQLTGNRRAEPLDTLGAAYAEAGRFPEAVNAAEKALVIATKQADRKLADAVRSRIALYEAGKPFHQDEAGDRQLPRP